MRRWGDEEMRRWAFSGKGRKGWLVVRKKGVIG